jgi:hypothetical protein
MRGDRRFSRAALLLCDRDDSAGHTNQLRPLIVALRYKGRNWNVRMPVKDQAAQNPAMIQMISRMAKSDRFASVMPNEPQKGDISDAERQANRVSGRRSLAGQRGQPPRCRWHVLIVRRVVIRAAMAG